MADIRARDLMLRSCRTIVAGASLREAMDELVALQSDPKIPNVLGVLDDDGRFAGILTARLLCRSLLALWSPSRAVREDESRLEHELLDVVRDRYERQVRDAVIRGLPSVGPEERVLVMIEQMCDQRLEYLPVVDDGRLLGVVPVSVLFNAAAELALTPEHRGIRLDP